MSREKIRIYVNIFIAVIAPLVYGIAYLANILINGMGEWPDTNDWYLFFAWGYPAGMIIYAVIVTVTWLLAFGMRKGQQAHLKALSKKGSGAAKIETQE